MNVCHLTQFAVFEMSDNGNAVKDSSSKILGTSKLVFYVVIPVAGAVLIGAVILTVFLVRKKKYSRGFF